VQQIAYRKKNITYNNLAGYLFILPWLAGFFFYTILPMLMSLYYSLTQYNILSPAIWVGLKNYINIFTNDPRFWKSLQVTFKYVIFAVPLRLIFALFLAILLAQKRLFVNVYRGLFYIPSLIGGSVAVAVMWKQLFGVEGALNSILISLGILDKGFGWLTHPKTALWTLILLAVWQFGSPMLIFLAGLKQIPISLYESASIDGANWWQSFIKITIPMLTPVIFFNLIMQIIHNFMMFTQAYIITGGGPFDETLLYILYIYKRGFTYYQMGYACALAWILLTIVGVITFIVFRTSHYWVYYEAKE
jgi:multiple sugar transport system permease protein